MISQKNGFYSLFIHREHGYNPISDRIHMHRLLQSLILVPQLKNLEMNEHSREQKLNLFSGEFSSKVVEKQQIIRRCLMTIFAFYNRLNLHEILKILFHDQTEMMCMPEAIIKWNIFFVWKFKHAIHDAIDYKLQVLTEYSSSFMHTLLSILFKQFMFYNLFEIKNIF